MHRPAGSRSPRPRVTPLTTEKLCAVAGGQDAPAEADVTCDGKFPGLVQSVSGGDITAE
jgi:hypothetical protein